MSFFSPEDREQRRRTRADIETREKENREAALKKAEELLPEALRQIQADYRDGKWRGQVSFSANQLKFNNPHAKVQQYDVASTLAKLITQETDCKCTYSNPSSDSIGDNTIFQVLFNK